MQQNNNSFVDQNEQQNTENEMSIQKIIGILLANRVVFLTSVIAFIVAAWVYLRYATPEYEINAKILIKDDKKDADANLPDQGMLQSIGLLSGKSNVDNELEIIKTELLMEQVVKTLQLNVKYFGKGRIKTTELYNDRPFDIHFTPLFEDSLKNGVESYSLAFSKNDNFILKKGKKTWAGKWGDTVFLP